MYLSLGQYRCLVIRFWYTVIHDWSMHFYRINFQILPQIKFSSDFHTFSMDRLKIFCNPKHFCKLYIFQTGKNLFCFPFVFNSIIWVKLTRALLGNSRLLYVNEKRFWLVYKKEQTIEMMTRGRRFSAFN